MGDKVLKEVLEKVSFIIQQKNSKQTGAAPGGIS